jgi:hypothetical protein
MKRNSREISKTHEMSGIARPSFKASRDFFISPELGGLLRKLR